MTHPSHRPTLPRLFAALLAALLFAGLGAALAQEDCPRGKLDTRYCDRDDDLVADVPERTQDPSVLIFSYTPVEDPAVYERAWSDFIDHLAQATGKEVRFFVVENYAAQLEALRAGRLHIAGVNTGSVPVAVNIAGFVPFAMMAAEDGSYGYEMEIIVPADSAIEGPEDLAGKTLAFTSPTSNSGFKAPSAILKGEFGLVADEDFSTTFSGRHDNSITGVAAGDYEAAAIANSVKERMLERGVVSEDDLRVIYRSQTFPTTAYGHAHDLDPELAQKIRDAFFSFEWEGTTLEAEFSQNGEAQFLPITYLEEWDVIRRIDEANEVEYTLP